jgi:hypothetical protein
VTHYNAIRSERTNLPSPDHQVLFRESLLEIYKEPSGFYGWTYYYHKEYPEIFNEEPLYNSFEDAWRSAKLHSVKSEVLRSRDIGAIISYATDCVICQSKSAIRQFGNAAGMEALPFYDVPQERIDYRKQLHQQGKAETRTRLLSLTGLEFSGVVKGEIVPVDDSLDLIVEYLSLDDCRCR